MTSKQGTNDSEVFGTTGDAFKPLNEILLSDVRQRGFVRYDNGVMQPLSISDFHARMAEFELHSGVPEQVRAAFDTARNLYVYSWFVYRFGVVAERHAYSTLEAALGERIEQDNLPPANGLKRRLKVAVEKKWISAERVRLFQNARLRINEQAKWHAELNAAIGIPAPPIDDPAVEAKAAESYLNNLIDSIPGLRNHLSHGGSMLHNNAAMPIGICCDLINQLFTVHSD